jgi:hypothetical protein
MVASATAPASGTDTGAPPGLMRSESGGNFRAENPDTGASGRFQFMPSRLADAKRAGVIPPDMTMEQFRADKDAQLRAERWHFADVNNFIEKNDLGQYIGTSMNGVPVTRDGMVSVAHLGGNGGLRRFLESGGRYNPADANGTRLSDYLAMGAGQTPERKAAGVEVVKGDGSPVEKATRVASRYTEGNWEKIGEKVGVPELARDERVFVPLIAGIGALLASDKPRFSQALGEGLGAAAGAYGAVRGQTEELAESRGRQALTQAQTTRARFITAGDKIFLTYVGPDGNDEFMDLGQAFDRMDAGTLPRLEPAVMEELRQRARAAGRGTAKPPAAVPAAGTPSAATPESGTPKTGTPTGEGTPTESGATPESGARKPIPLPAGVEYDDKSVEQAKSDRRQYLRVGTTQGATMLAPEYLKNTRTGAEAAREDLRQFKELAAILSKAGNVTGIGVAGTAFPERAALIGAANTFIKALGGRGDIGDSAQVTQQLAEKIRTLSAASRAREGGQESFAALEKLSNAIANPSMDKEAYSKLISEVMTMQRRLLDRSNHANRFAKDSDNVMQGAPSDFERLHPVATYDKEAKALQRLMTDPEQPDLFPSLVSGKWPSGRPVTAAQIEKIGRDYGLRPGFSLYFRGGQ